MKIINKAKNLELTDALESYIEEKVGALKKFIDTEFFVEVEKETRHHNKGELFSCQLELQVPGKLLLVKASSDDLYKAIVAAKKEMEEEIKRHKLKQIEKPRREQRKAKGTIQK